jgi:hypothetical protein
MTGMAEFLAERLGHSLKPKKGYEIVVLHLPTKLHASINTYLDSTGLEDSEGMTRFVQFGLGLPQSDEFASVNEEIRKLSEGLSDSDRRFGDKKLEAYENYMENKALAVELASLLSENSLLRKRLASHDLLGKHWAGEHQDKMRDAQHFLSKYTFEPKL